MAPNAQLKNAFRLITFDVYSALLDINQGLSEALSNATKLPIETVLPAAQVWRVKQMERAAASNSLSAARTSFRDCTRQALRYTNQRFSLGLDDASQESLVFAWDTLPLWPEANDAVTHCKNAGYDIAILSNGDQDMLEAVSRLFDTPFDYVLSSEAAGVYKPHPSVYALPRNELGVAAEDTLHVAGGHTDVLGAVRFGLPCVWSMKNECVLLDSDVPPTYTIPNLEGLPELLKTLTS